MAPKVSGELGTALPEQSTCGRRGGNSAGHKDMKWSCKTRWQQPRIFCRVELSAQRQDFFLEHLLYLSVFTAVLRGEGSADEKPKGNLFISLKSN